MSLEYNVDVFNIKANSYYIATSQEVCWRCRSKTHVHSFLLSENYETLEFDDETGFSYWRKAYEPTFVSYVTTLTPEVVSVVKKLSLLYRLNFSRKAQRTYWMNHCEHCKASQGDHFMYGEPGGAFSPTNEVDAGLITLRFVGASFGANSDTGGNADFFHCMRLVNTNLLDL